MTITHESSLTAPRAKPGRRPQGARRPHDKDLDLGLGLPSGFGLGQGFSSDPRGVIAAGLPFGLLCCEALRGLIGPR